MDEDILDMQLADGMVVMLLTGVPSPLRPGHRLRFPSFGCWTVLRARPHPTPATRVEVAVRLDESTEGGADGSRPDPGPPAVRDPG